MAPPVVSRRKANATFNGIFLIGLGILFFTNTWWPGILLVIGVSLAARQYLRGRIYDTILSSVIFGGLFITSLLDWNASVLIPVLFTVAGIYLLYSEWFMYRERVGDEAVEAAEKEIEDAEPGR